MPTLEDITYELSGATVFSHLDINHGYHQLELEEYNRDITTFSKHVGLYRFKKLSFGTRSAGEIFQDTVSMEISQDTAGTKRRSQVTGHRLWSQKFKKKVRHFIRLFMFIYLLDFRLRHNQAYVWHRP